MKKSYCLWCKLLRNYYCDFNKDKFFNSLTLFSQHSSPSWSKENLEELAFDKILQEYLTFKLSNDKND